MVPNVKSAEFKNLSVGAGKVRVAVITQGTPVSQGGGVVAAGGAAGREPVELPWRLSNPMFDVDGAYAVEGAGDLSLCVLVDDIAACAEQDCSTVTLTDP